jgi:hypothetical protein
MCSAALALSQKRSSELATFTPRRPLRLDGRLENFDTADVDASPIERGGVHLVTTVIDMQIVPFEYGGIRAKQATALSELR